MASSTTVTAAAMLSPLNGQAHQAEGLVVRELPVISKVVLRGDFDDEGISSAIESTIDLPAQLNANTFVSNATHSIFWMGPDERIVYSAEQDATALVNSLQERLPSGKSAVVDVSDYYTVIRVSGDKARSVLASGTPFDVHPRVFKAGHCAQTRFGQASIMLSNQEADNGYDLQVRWSFAEYLWGYLCRVGAYV